MSVAAITHRHPDSNIDTMKLEKHGSTKISPISVASSHGSNGRRMNERSLAEAEVDLYNEAGGGSCHIRTSLLSFNNGYVAATGVTFSVQAFGAQLEIQAIEFANTPDSTPSTVSIYARKGTSFSTTATDWIALAFETTSVVAPDGLGMMVPRVEI